MRRMLAGAVIAVVVALGCSGCGDSGRTSISRSVTVSRTSGPSAKGLRLDGSIPVRLSGVGNATLGTFAIHGWLVLRATCVGKGKFEVTYVNGANTDGASSACLNSGRQPTLSSGSNFGEEFDRATIEVRATPGTRWTVSVRRGTAPAPSS